MLGQQKLLFKGKIRIYINLSKWIRRHGRWLCRAGKLALSTVNWAFLGLLLCFTETPFHIVNFKVERGMFWTYDQSSFGPHNNSPQTSSWKLHLSRKPGCCVGYLVQWSYQEVYPTTRLSHQWLQWSQWLLGSQTSEVTFYYSVLTHLFPYTNSTSTSSNLSQAPSILHLGWQA